MLINTLLLSKNQKATIDPEDYEYLSQWKWYVSHYGYAVTNWQGRKIYMHRLLMETPEGLHTDHINRDKLDNRKSNLRICENSQNVANRPKQSNNTSGYKGVFWSIQQNKWAAKINIKGKQIHLGFHNDKKEAARAYDTAAKEKLGEYAYPNGVPQ